MRKLFVVALVVMLTICMGVALTPQAEAAFGDTSRYIGQRQLRDGGNALNAYLDNPKGMVMDKQGNMYIADTKNNAIRKINGETNTIETYANVTGEYGKTDGFRLMATFSEPTSLAMDGEGRIYVADSLNHAIRRIDGTSVSTIVDDSISNPQGITVRGGQLYISDTGHNRVVVTDLNGNGMKTVAGPFAKPTKLDWQGYMLYVVSEGNGSVSQIDLRSKEKSRLAGGFSDIGSISVRGDHTLYVAAGKQGVWNEIYKVRLDSGEKTQLSKRRETEWLNWASDMSMYNNRLYILFSGGSSLYSFDMLGQDETKIAGVHRYGDEYGTPAETILGRPHSLVWHPNGFYLYFFENNKIAEYNIVTQETKYMAGSVMDNYVEGQGTTARFSDPTQITISPDGKTVYIADRNNHRIRKFDVKTKTSSYITGAGRINFYGKYEAYQEGGPCPEEFETGKAGCAYFNRPTGVAINSAGTKLYIADSGNNRIREVDINSGRTRNLAGNGNAGLKDGFGPLAELNGPFNVSIDKNDRILYITDKQNHAIRALDLQTLNLSTVVGKSGRPGYLEASANRALLQYPEGIVVGNDGQLYFTEAGSQRVRMFNFSSNSTKLVSGSGQRGLMTGSGPNARWNGPKGITQRGTDGSALYVCDFYSDMIKRVSLI
ncbi:hypothetical protein ACFL2B_00420 [Patescibacteria group bacterium]